MKDITKEMICDVRYIDDVIGKSRPKAELIRCKDCRHFEADDEEMTMYCANDMLPTTIVCTGLAYCSEAERKRE